MSAYKSILVTGGAGFIGSHTVHALLQQGVEVIVLDNLFSGKLENLNLQDPNLTFIEGDILEYPFVEELISKCDAVLHLAAIVSVPLSIENPIYSFQVNTQGFLHILEAIRKANRSIRFVYASSAAIYGDNKGLPCRDDAPLTNAPISPYALQKIHAENYADLYFRLHGISSLGLRYFNVYGERQEPNSPYSGVISRFLSAYQQNNALVIFGDGQQSRDFIHVSDVAKANLLALQSDYTGKLNIATGQSQTLLSLIEYIEQAGHKTAKKIFEPERQGDVKISLGSIEMAEQHLNFRYSKMLADEINHLIKRGEKPC